VNIAPSHIKEHIDIEVSGDDFSATITENNSGELNVPSVTVINEGAFCATHITFGNYNSPLVTMSNEMLSNDIFKYNRQFNNIKRFYIFVRQKHNIRHRQI
jgi:hypothetical protein